MNHPLLESITGEECDKRPSWHAREARRFALLVLIPSIFTFALPGCAMLRCKSAVKNQAWEDAYEACDQWWRQKPEDPQRATLLASVKISASKALVAEAQEVARRGDLNLPEALLHKALERWPENDLAKRSMAQVRADRTAWSARFHAAKLQVTHAEKDSRLWSSALDALRPLQPFAPTFPELPALLEHAKRKVDSQALQARAERAAGEARFEAAITDFLQALELDPQNRAAHAGLHGARVAAAMELTRDAVSALRGRQYKRAIGLYEQIISVATGQEQELCANAARGISAVKQTLSLAAQRRAAQAASQELYAAAWVYGRLSALVVGGPPPPPSAHVQEALRYLVALQTRGSAASSTALAKALIAQVPPSGGFTLISGNGPADGRLLLHLEAPVVADQFVDKVPREKTWHEKNVSEPNQQWQGKQTEINQLQQRIRESRRDLSTARQALDSAKTARQQAEREQLNAEQASAEWRRGCEMARQRTEQLKRKRSPLEDRVKVLDAEISRLREQLDHTDLTEESKIQLRNRIFDLQSERDMKQGELNHSLPEFEQAEATVTRLQSDTSATTRAEAAQQAVSGAQLQLAQTQENVSQHISQIAQLESTAQQAQADLQRISPTILRPIHSVMRYEVERWTRSARMKALVQILDERGRFLWLQQELVVDEASTPEERHPRVFRAGIEPLDVPAQTPQPPTPEEMERRMIAKLLPQLSGVVMGALAHHGDRFVRAKAGLDGDALINVLAMIYQARPYLSRAEEATAAEHALQQQLGIMLSSDAVAWAQLDGFQ